MGCTMASPCPEPHHGSTALLRQHQKAAPSNSRRRQLGKSESPMAQAGTSAFSALAMAIQRTGTVQDTKERLAVLIHALGLGVCITLHSEACPTFSVGIYTYTKSRTCLAVGLFPPPRALAHWLWVRYIYLTQSQWG